MKPLLIGIAGGTGSGKTTVSRKIAAGLPPDSSQTIEHDSYYHDRSDLPHEERALLNFDHPDSLDNQLLYEHLRVLREGRAVDVPVYDFKTHARLPQQRRVQPAPVIIVEGILVFVEERVRSLLDMKIFVDTDADIRVMRRIRRDMESRGRTFQQVREQYYKTVRPMHLQFVEPSKRYADIIVPRGGHNTVAINLIIATILRRLQGGAA
jgi:uridine kinase